MGKSRKFSERRFPGDTDAPFPGVKKYDRVRDRRLDASGEVSMLFALVFDGSKGFFDMVIIFFYNKIILVCSKSD